MLSNCKTMKKIIPFLVLLILAACTPEKLDLVKSKELAESLIKKISEGEYTSLSVFYTGSLNEGESEEARAEKFTKLNNAFGKLKSFEMIKAEDEVMFGEPSRIILTYRIEHENVTSTETFTIEKEEGEYKVARHQIVAE